MRHLLLAISARELMAWQAGSAIGLMAVGLWWDTHGEDFKRRRAHRLFGTCRGCGRAKESCSCTTYEGFWEDDE